MPDQNSNWGLAAGNYKRIGLLHDSTLPTSGGTITGNLTVTGTTTLDGTTATTPATADNSTHVATTAFVKAQGYAPIASPAFTGTPAAPTFNATTSFTLNGHNITPGQIGAASAFPGPVPADGPTGMMGLGFTFTPQSSTRVLAVVTGSGVVDTASGAYTYRLMYGTGTPPARGAASTGTGASGYFQLGNALAAGAQIPVPLIAIVSGLTIGTTYWFDVYATASTGNTTFFSCAYSFLEV